MNIDNSASLGAAASTLGRTDDPKKIHESAQQFESLLIAQMLKASRESGGAGWLGTGDDDDAGETGVEMAEQQLAQSLAEKGGLGLARLIEQGLTKDAKLAGENVPDPAGTAAGSGE